MQQNKFRKRLIITGAALIAVSLSFLLYLFYPALKVEIEYLLSDKGEGDVVVLEEDIVEVKDQNKDKDEEDFIVPVDEDFGIVIPKIGANSKVVANVDPYNSEIYQQKLSEGVAHAEGTSLPNENGNVFMFAHSSVDFYEANRWNSIFYLLHRMEEGDEVYIVYKNEIYKYEITQIEKVEKTDISYLTKQTEEKILTLMTCWPPGTDWERLIVTAKLVE